MSERERVCIIYYVTPTHRRAVIHDTAKRVFQRVRESREWDFLRACSLLPNQQHGYQSATAKRAALYANPRCSDRGAMDEAKGGKIILKKIKNKKYV